MSRVSRAQAQATLEAYVLDIVGGPARAALASPRVMALAIKKAEGMLNRPTRRALGARSDGRFHPLAATKVMVHARGSLCDYCRGRLAT